jgi:hypothetical protein
VQVEVGVENMLVEQEMLVLVAQVEVVQVVKALMELLALRTQAVVAVAQGLMV